MIVESDLFSQMIGNLPDGKYYIRKQHGRLRLCKCPDRSKQVPTAAQLAHREKFRQMAKSGELAELRFASGKFKPKN